VAPKGIACTRVLPLTHKIQKQQHRYRIQKPDKRTKQNTKTRQKNNTKYKNKMKAEYPVFSLRNGST